MFRPITHLFEEIVWKEYLEPEVDGYSSLSKVANDSSGR